MGEVKLTGLIDNTVLDAIIANAPKDFYQVNIFCSVMEFQDYVRPNHHFDFELNGAIENKVLLLASETYKGKRFNYVVSDYFLKNKYMEAKYIYDENYSAIREYITKKA